MLKPSASVAVSLLLLLLAAGCGEESDDEQAAQPQLIIEAPEENDDSERIPGPPTFPSTATTHTLRIAGADPAADAAGVATAVFPSTTDASRPDAVALVDSDDWPAAVAGSVLMSGELGAPLLVSNGDELSPIAASALARLDPAGSDLADDAQVIRVGDRVARPEGRRTAVIGGGDQYELAASIDRFSATAEGARSDAVVIASGEQPEWAMPAGAWAARSGDAVLFAREDELPEPTRAAIEAHEKPDIYVLGPESVISENVVGDLEELGKVERIEGPTPVENAIEFARYQAPDFGWGLVTPGHNFTIASTSRPVDAAAAAALGTEGTFAPLLLTDDPAAIPEPLEQYFLDVQPGFEENPNTGVQNRVLLLGDQRAISVAQQAEIDEVTELIPVQIDEDAAAGRRGGGDAGGGQLDGGALDAPGSGGGGGGSGGGLDLPGGGSGGGGP